jgi:2'-5' RNA ligase
MRLFIGIDLSEEIKDYLDSLKIKADINWVPRDNYHITLKFLGDVDDPEPIIDNLRNVKLDRFSTKLDKFGFFPNEDYIKVFWIGCFPDYDLIELHKKVEKALPGYKKENGFVAHITLARVRYMKDKDFFKKKVGELQIENKEIVVNSFQLFESRLGRDGLTYQILENFKY